MEVERQRVEKRELLVVLEQVLVLDRSNGGLRNSANKSLLSVWGKFW
jgi:hypothetical protein